jgi:glycerol-3-phosphate dehydrogenase (NAD(P)+)
LKVAILGGGAWGTALAISLSSAHAVRLWTRAPADRDALRSARESRYLPGAPLPAEVDVPATLAEAVEDAGLALVATSTAGLRPTCLALAPIAPRIPLLWACKGFEQPSFFLPHQIVAEALPQSTSVGALSGPSFAREVAEGRPTAVVLASSDEAFARATMAALNGPRLRVYSSNDLVGVELGGAVKNVIAVAAGISDGLGLGHNARAALVTRGLAEIVRLGMALGGQRETFMGLAGLGDLVLTTTGDLSRNRAVGMALGRGQELAAVLAELGHVAEGVVSAPAVLERARAEGIEMPITAAVCDVVAGRAPAAAAVAKLLGREPRAE